jgi:hypothetical protein
MNRSILVLVVCVFAASLLAMGCTGNPTGNYAQGSNVHALKTTMGLVKGAFIPAPDVCTANDNSACVGAGDPDECCTGEGQGTCTRDAVYTITGTNAALDNSACVGAGDPAECCTGEEEGTCPSAAPIQYAATTGDDLVSCIACYGFALADISGSIPDNEDCVDVDDPEDCCTGAGTGTCVQEPFTTLSGEWVDCTTVPPTGGTPCTLNKL